MFELMSKSTLVLAPILAAFAIAVPALARPVTEQTQSLDRNIMEHPEKIGIGTFQRSTEKAIIREVEEVRANWFYTWRPTSPSRDDRFIPMVWGSKDIAKIEDVTGSTLLTFNEPDRRDQSNMTTEEALALWPGLMATGKRLGSPATSECAVKAGGWFQRFMAGAKLAGYRVDFVAVHYYSKTTDVADLKNYLTAVYEAYRRPIWLTEWALDNFPNSSRFTAEQQRAYFIAGTYMMDDLPYVERHAWFGMYEGLGGWYLKSGLLTDKGKLSRIGLAFRALARPKPGGWPSQSQGRSRAQQMSDISLTKSRESLIIAPETPHETGTRGAGDLKDAN